MTLLLAVLAFIASPQTARAQAGAQPASIIGKVTDESNGVLPGVTVRVTGPALQVPELVTTTDANGEYRVTPLPIGTFQVEYTLQGFQTLRRANVELTLGFVARLDAMMKLSAVAETVTVSGSSPVVDTSSTAVSTSVNSATVQLLPSSWGGVASLLAQVPGFRANIDVGGDQALATPVFIYNGQNGSAWTLMEGVLAGRQSGSGAGVKYDPLIIEGARMQAVGNGAEMPKRGVLIDVVSKSGGNEFHGIASASQTSSSLQSNNIDDSLKAAGINAPPKLDDRWDRSGQIGGPIMRNRLWFFTSYRQLRSDNDVLNTFNPDGSPYVHYQKAHYQADKLSYQLNPNNQIIGFYHLAHQYEQGGGGLAPASQFTPPHSALLQNDLYNVGKVEWQATHGSNLLTSLQTGIFTGDSTSTGFDPGAPSTKDLVTLKQDGNTIYDGRDQYARILHNRGFMTLFGNKLGGSHALKVGFDHIREIADLGLANRPEGNDQLQFSNGVPSQIVIFNNPTNSISKESYFDLYAQDDWRIGGRLTLSLGVRGAHDAASVPSQCQPANQFAAAFPAQCFADIDLKVWNSLVPRLHASYDLTGDGKTAVKGGWGRFVKRREIQNYDVTYLNPNGNLSSTYRWHDLNNNRRYDTGEVNLDPNGSDFISFGSPAGGVLNPNELQPYEDELSASFERQLIPNLAVRVSAVYAKNHNVYRTANPLIPPSAYTIPITNPDPGPDGIVGNSDDPGRTFTYYDFPASYRGAKFAGTQLVNDDPRNDTTYKTIEAALSRRLANKWQLNASFAYTSQNVPFGDATTSALALNPNAEINAANNAPSWIGKASGAYTFPLDILGSFNLDLRSGDPLARQVLFKGGSSIPNIVLNVEPIGSIRLPATKMLDFRAAKRFRIWSQTLEVGIDLYNVLNTSTPTALTVRSGPTFMVPTAIVLPRIIDFEVKYTF